MDDNKQSDTLISEPATSAPARDSFGRLLPGNTANTAGRPRKGQTIAERLAKADAAIARKALKARDKRLELINAVGQKTYENYLAYTVGLPAQKYVVETQDSPLLAFLQRHAPELPYVEGESRELPGDDGAVRT